ncbi:MAG: hypothetical protein ACQEUT_18205 [Bacillota bacterium]
MPDIVSASDYINLNVIDIDDWLDSDENRQTRVLNVAIRVINDVYSDLIIPDSAVYEFCPILAAYFNDTNKLNSQGIASFSIQGVGSFNFDQEKTLEELIPLSAIRMIAKENGIELSGNTAGKATLKYNV